MKRILRAIVLGALLSPLCSFAQDRANIIFLLTDDQSTSSVGSYGNPDVQTPQLDRLAGDGVSFDRYYTTTAICMASRATSMTGKYEYKTGCNFGHGDLLSSLWQQSYPVLLREAGYTTAFAGKFGFELRDAPGGEKRGMPEGDFDRWGGGPGQTHYETARNESMAAYAKDYPHSTRSYGAFGRDFIKDSAQGDAPFCLSISFKAPHQPQRPDPIDDDVYAGKVFEKPDNYGRENGEHFSRQSRQGRQYTRFHDWHYSDEYDRVMATYYQQVYAIDAAVGMIRDALVDAGVDDNTVIIFTSDNGFLNGSHGYGSKVLPYEEASRVPMIIYDPRSANSGQALRRDALAANIDIAPTILSLAGLPIPQEMDGGDLMRVYEDPTAAIHESIALINVWGAKPVQAMGVVTRDKKYLYWSYAAADFEATEELYNLAKDPSELANLAAQSDSRADLKAMRRIYDQHLARWQSQAVSHHGYQLYSTYFDRSASWAEKAAVIAKSGENR
ncbi:sulfatase-like hydrolase/transferase [Opitutaceae bacterium]|nr:sulfatase-like hydrolase/transferase [Opitutaceae bacterium]